MKTSEQMKHDISIAVADVENRLTIHPFTINPLQGVDGAPFGFHTVGNTQILLPEYFVSGVLVNDERFRRLYPVIHNSGKFLTMAGCAMHPSIEIARVINEQLVIGDMDDEWLAVPIDPMRLMYGQGLVLRYWAESRDIAQGVTAIQFIWKNKDDPSFPVASTAQQLLIDYVPFGTPCPTPIGVEHALPA